MSPGNAALRMKPEQYISLVLISGATVCAGISNSTGSRRGGGGPICVNSPGGIVSVFFGSGSGSTGGGGGGGGGATGSGTGGSASVMRVIGLRRILSLG